MVAHKKKAAGFDSLDDFNKPDVELAHKLGMTVVEVSQAEIDKARNMMKPAWDNWLKRTGQDGIRAIELANKALGR